MRVKKMRCGTAARRRPAFCISSSSALACSSSNAARIIASSPLAPLPPAALASLSRRVRSSAVAFARAADSCCRSCATCSMRGALMCHLGPPQIGHAHIDADNPLLCC